VRDGQFITTGSFEYADDFAAEIVAALATR
jgi:hypothetical protein